MIVIPRNEHIISRKSIRDEALKVLYRLHRSGFAAYLVGGCVRDLLLGREPKDFDIATNAEPEQIQALFRNCRLIGRRFRLAHIVFGKYIIEVATFRARHLDTHAPRGMVIRDNVYGTIEDDAWRRDFTVNALYYNIADFSVVDYTSGMADLKQGCLRMIGDPLQRYQEDPVRLLRVIRFAGKLGFTISTETEMPIQALSDSLHQVSSSRLYQEVLKCFHEGHSLAIVKLLQHYGLLAQLFPETAECLDDPVNIFLIEQALAETDKRIREGKPISTAFIFSVFLWPPIRRRVEQYLAEEMSTYHAYEKAIRAVIKKVKERLSIPRGVLFPLEEICMLQYRLSKYKKSFPNKITRMPRFRAGYDLWVLRKESGE